MTPSIATMPADPAQADPGPMVLPPGVESVVDLSGGLSIVRVQSTREGDLARHLNEAGIGFYNPREQVVREYRVRDTEKRVVRRWYRGLIPGVLFVADGQDGRDACQQYGRLWSGRFYGYIGPVFEGPTGHLLMAELLRMERYIRSDPQLKAVTGLRHGTRVRIIAGEFEGCRGVIHDPDGRSEVILVRSSLMGVDVEIRIDRQFLELA